MVTRIQLHRYQHYAPNVQFSLETIFTGSFIGMAAAASSFPPTIHKGSYPPHVALVSHLYHLNDLAFVSAEYSDMMQSL